MERVFGLFGQLRKRNVLRAAVLYVGAAWALAQGISQLAPAVGAPDWVTRWFLIATCIGFPFWLALAWFYGPATDDANRDSDTGPAEAVAQSSNRKVDLAIIGVLSVALVLALADRFVAHRSAATPVDDKSIAVLPFDNMSADAGNAYFADGMRDLILTKLADIGDLRVISRTSTQSYKSRPDSLKDVAAELGVATVLEGSVQRSGNDVLVSVQLIDARTDRHIWAQSYQRTLDNIFGVEGEVATRIADSLKSKLTAGETARLSEAPTLDARALDHFLRAEYIAHEGHMLLDLSRIRLALPPYEQAVSEDPAFALAFARLSYTESLLVWLGADGAEAETLIANARTHAEKALALQPDLPDAHLALGFYEYYGKHDYDAALKAFDEALEERPNDADAMAAKAFVLRRQGHIEESIRSLEVALARDPRNARVAFNLCATRTMRSLYAQAELACLRALAINATDATSRAFLANLMILEGDPQRALATASGDNPVLRLQRAVALSKMRRFREAIAETEGIADTPDNFQWLGGPKSLNLASLHESAGDTVRAKELYAEALPILEKALDDASIWPTKAAVIWSEIASAKLAIDGVDAALDAIAKSESFLQFPDHVYGPTARVASASVAARAGHADLAVSLLERVFEDPAGGMFISAPLLAIDPEWDPIRHDAKFAELLRRHGVHPSDG